MTRLIRGILLTVLLGSFALPTQATARKSFLSDVSLSLQFGGRYVDNAIRLSEADIDRFQNSPQPFETPLKAYDDWKNELVLKPTLRLRLPQRHRLIAVYSFKMAEFANNPFLNYQTHTLNLYFRPMSLKRWWLVNFRAFTIPSYYLRNHYDRDTGAFHAARFQNWQYRIAPRFRFWKPLWIKFQAEFETLYYNTKFTEYDGEMISVGLGGDYNGLKPFNFSLMYLRNHSDNIGHSSTDGANWNSLDPLGSDTEYGDATFDEDEFFIRGTGHLTHLFSIPIRGNINAQLRRRIYTTDNSLENDPFHRGRLDVRWKITPSITAAVTPTVNITLGAGYEERTTTSDVARVEEIKDFRVREAYIAFEYELP